MLLRFGVHAFPPFRLLTGERVGHGTGTGRMVRDLEAELSSEFYGAGFITRRSAGGSDLPNRRRIAYVRIWCAKVGVVEDIEGVGAELQGAPIVNSCIFCEAHIPVLPSWPPEHVVP